MRKSRLELFRALIRAHQRDCYLQNHVTFIMSIPCSLISSRSSTSPASFPLDRAYHKHPPQLSTQPRTSPNRRFWKSRQASKYVIPILLEPSSRHAEPLRERHLVILRNSRMARLPRTTRSSASRGYFLILARCCVVLRTDYSTRLFRSLAAFYANLAPLDMEYRALRPVCSSRAARFWSIIYV